MKKIKFLILFFVTLFSSCSPKLNKKDYALPQSNLRPDLQNQEEFNQLQLSAENFNLVWNEKVPLFATLNVVSDMLEISQDEKNPSIKNSAFAIYQNVMSLNTAVKVSFTETPYMRFFKELSMPEVKSSLKELNTTLILNLAAIKKTLAKVKANINWPFKASYKESEQLMLKFLDLFVDEINQLHLSKVVDQELRNQIIDEKKHNYFLLNKFYSQIYREISLKNILNVIENMLIEFDISLDLNSRDKLQRGKGLVESIESINDEATAYSAIVEIWFYLDKEERKEYIKQISDAFYYYLKVHSDKDLKCLKNKDCDLSIKAKIRDWGIFPQIKNFGIQKIKKELNQKTHAYALSVLEENLLKTIKNLDQKVFLKVNKNIQKGQEEIQRINKNTEAFINERVLDWMDKNFDTKKESINGFEYGQIEINLQKKKFTIKEVNDLEINRTAEIDTDLSRAGVKIASRDIGASFRAAVNIWQNGFLDDKQYKRSLLEQINKIMGFGGLPLENGVSKGIVNGLD
ncbi:MAG: hypothetical protein L6Q37_15290, partial [Bdellovibrionaceae bacterium]|nr:hypothetical protein [Pseudobdellovibrionaceae bacterium]